MAAVETPTREEEAKSYLEEHNIMQLFNDLTSSLVYHRPENPRKFMIQQIEKIRQAQGGPFYKPLLLKKKNASAIFDTLDPIGRGHITVSQYTETLKRLGVSGFESYDHDSDIKVTREMFITQFDDGDEEESAQDDDEVSRIDVADKPADVNHKLPDSETGHTAASHTDDSADKDNFVDDPDVINSYAADDADDEACDNSDLDNIVN